MFLLCLYLVRFASFASFFFSLPACMLVVCPYPVSVDPFSLSYALLMSFIFHLVDFHDLCMYFVLPSMLLFACTFPARYLYY